MMEHNLEHNYQRDEMSFFYSDRHKNHKGGEYWYNKFPHMQSKFLRSQINLIIDKNKNVSSSSTINKLYYFIINFIEKKILP